MALLNYRGGFHWICYLVVYAIRRRWNWDSGERDRALFTLTLWRYSFLSVTITAQTRVLFRRVLVRCRMANLVRLVMVGLGGRIYGCLGRLAISRRFCASWGKYRRACGRTMVFCCCLTRGCGLVELLIKEFILRIISCLSTLLILSWALDRKWLLLIWGFSSVATT